MPETMGSNSGPVSAQEYANAKMKEYGNGARHREEHFYGEGGQKRRSYKRPEPMLIMKDLAHIEVTPEQASKMIAMLLLPICPYESAQKWLSWVSTQVLQAETQIVKDAEQKDKEATAYKEHVEAFQRGDTEPKQKE